MLVGMIMPDQSKAYRTDDAKNNLNRVEKIIQMEDNSVQHLVMRLDAPMPEIDDRVQKVTAEKSSVARELRKSEIDKFLARLDSHALDSGYKAKTALSFGLTVDAKEQFKMLAAIKSIMNEYVKDGDKEKAGQAIFQQLMMNQERHDKALFGKPSALNLVIINTLPEDIKKSERIKAITLQPKDTENAANFSALLRTLASVRANETAAIIQEGKAKNAEIDKPNRDRPKMK
jgi:hypothetical protein